MDGKTVYSKDVFTRQDVADAYDAAYGKIIGAHLIHEVELKMDVYKLSEISRTDLSDSARECIEWGLRPGDVAARKNWQEQHDIKVARLLARLQDEIDQSGEKDGCCTDG